MMTRIRIPDTHLLITEAVFISFLVRKGRFHSHEALHTSDLS